VVTTYPVFLIESSGFFESRFGCPGSRIKSTDKNPNADLLNEAEESPFSIGWLSDVHTTPYQGCSSLLSAALPQSYPPIYFALLRGCSYTHSPPAATCHL